MPQDADASQLFPGVVLRVRAAVRFVDWAASKKFAEFIVANKINYVPTRTDVKTSNPILDLSKIHTVQVDTAWKGEKRKEYTQRWINEVIK